MKKFLALSILSLSILAGASAANAQTMTSTTTTTTRTTTMQRRPMMVQNRRMRVVTRTRVTRVGGRVYRETVRTTYYPNGRVTTRVVSRVRVR